MRSMIIVFLIILIMALIIANMLIRISRSRPRPTDEKGFSNPANLHYEEPEVITHVQNLNENTALLQGSLQATNQKLDLITQRVSSLERVVAQLVEKKIKTNIKEIDEEN